MSFRKTNWFGHVLFISVLGLTGAAHTGVIDLTEEGLSSKVDSLSNMLGDDSNIESLKGAVGAIFTQPSSNPCTESDCVEVAAAVDWVEPVIAASTTVELTETSVDVALVSTEDAVETCKDTDCPNLIDTVASVSQEPENTIILEATKPFVAIPDDADTSDVWIATADDGITLTPKVDTTADGYVMLTDVLFDFGKSTLLPDGVARLQSIADNLQPVKHLEIVGHTDSVGPDDDNFQLGQERADAVLNWLKSNGYVEETLVFAISLGETKPTAANVLADGSDNPKGRAMNRRVELRIVDRRVN